MNQVLHVKTGAAKYKWLHPVQGKPLCLSWDGCDKFPVDVKKEPQTEKCRLSMQFTDGASWNSCVITYAQLAAQAIFITPLALAPSKCAEASAWLRHLASVLNGSIQPISVACQLGLRSWPQQHSLKTAVVMHRLSVQSSALKRIQASSYVKTQEYTPDLWMLGVCKAISSCFPHPPPLSKPKLLFAKWKMMLS